MKSNDKAMDANTPERKQNKKHTVFYVKRYSKKALKSNFFDKNRIDNTRKIALEYIAYQFYGLVCRIPDLVICYQIKNKKIDYYLASRVEPGYQDLADFLAITPTSLIEIEPLKKIRDKIKLIQGLGYLLAMAAFLMDLDFIGRSYRNAGVVSMEKSFETLKIDPGSANLLSDMGNYKDYVSKKHPLILELFNSKLYAPGVADLLGSANPDEDLSGIIEMERLKGIKAISLISDELINEIVNNHNLFTMLTSENRYQIITTLQSRRETLADLYHEELAKISNADISLRPRQGSQQAVILPLEHFVPLLEKDTTPHYGISSPKKYRRKTGIYTNSGKKTLSSPKALPIHSPYASPIKRGKLSTPLSQPASPQLNNDPSNVSHPSYRLSPYIIHGPLPNYINKLREIIDTESSFLEKIHSFCVHIQKLESIIPVNSYKILNDINTVLKKLPKANVLQMIIHREVTVNNFSQSVQVLFEVICNSTLFQTNIIAPLYEISNQYTSLDNSLNSISATIEEKFAKLETNNPLKQAVQNYTQGDVIEYINGVMISAVQRLAKYPLLFCDLNKLAQKALPDEKDLINKLTKIENKIKQQTEDVNNSLNPSFQTQRKTASLYIAETGKKNIISISSNESLKLQPIAPNEEISVSNEVRSLSSLPHVKFLAKVLEITNCYLNTSLYSPSNTYHNYRLGWKSEAEAIARCIEKAYGRNTHESAMVEVEAIVKAIKHRFSGRHSRLAKTLESLIALGQGKELEHQTEKCLPVSLQCAENNTQAETYIQQHIIQQVLFRIDAYSKKASVLQSKTLEALKEALNHLRHSQTAHSREQFQATITACLRKHLLLAGEVPQYFLTGAFGQMLKQITRYLDPIFAAANPSKIALSQDSFFIRLLLWEKPSSVLALVAPSSSLDEKNITTLCATIQRIRDYYGQTSLGKQFTLEAGIPPNKKNRWLASLEKLDNCVTNLYFASLKQNTITINTLLDEIQIIIDSIRKHRLYGEGSRLASTLEAVIASYQSRNVDTTKKGLPEEMLKPFTTEAASIYIHQHVVQQMHRPFLAYANHSQQRFFKRTAPAKLETVCTINQQFNTLYNDAAGSTCQSLPSVLHTLQNKAYAPGYQVALLRDGKLKKAVEAAEKYEKDILQNIRLT